MTWEQQTHGPHNFARRVTSNFSIVSYAAHCRRDQVGGTFPTDNMSAHLLAALNALLTLNADVTQMSHVCTNCPNQRGLDSCCTVTRNETRRWDSTTEVSAVSTAGAAQCPCCGRRAEEVAQAHGLHERHLRLVIVARAVQLAEDGLPLPTIRIHMPARDHSGVSGCCCTTACLACWQQAADWS